MLDTIYTIKMLIAILTAYFPTVALTGFFEAWMAKKFGDDTLEQEGRLTLDPWVHTRLLGLGMLIFAFIARFPLISTFGQYSTIDLSRISNPCRQLKYLMLLWARALMNVILCCSSILLWVLFWRLVEVPYAFEKTHGALTLALQMLYLVFREINLISAVLEFILGLVRFIISHLFPDLGTENLFFVMIVEIYLLIFSWYFVAPYLQLAIAVVERLFGYLVVSLIG